MVHNRIQVVHSISVVRTFDEVTQVHSVDGEIDQSSIFATIVAQTFQLDTEDARRIPNGQRFEERLCGFTPFTTELQLFRMDEVLHTRLEHQLGSFFTEIVSDTRIILRVLVVI